MEQTDSLHLVTLRVSETLLRRSIEESPRLLKRSAGGESCCIFRIPQSLSRINGTAYEPRIVSIGPYHHGKEHLKTIEEHKHRFLEFFVAKTQEKGVGIRELVNQVSRMEQEIRDSYSENLSEFDREKVLYMMVLDGCIIIALFCIVARLVEYRDSDDPVFSIPWILPFIRSDILLQENQVPLFVLQTLFKTSKLVPEGEEVAPSRALNKVAFAFFCYGIERPEDYYNLRAKHLLDLFRKSFIPVPSQEGHREEERSLQINSCFNQLFQRTSDMETSPASHPFLEFILSAKKLHLRGIKFEPSKNSNTFLDIKFKNGLLQIPRITIDDFISSVLLNCIAFEQFYADCPKIHITSYVAFMGCLINSAADVTFLTDKGIIENYFGTEEEVFRFFKNLGKDIAFDIEKSYLLEVFEEVNEYSSKGWRVQWAGFKHTYFDSPWSCVSSCAALTLLVLTLIQTFFAAYSYLHPAKNN